MEESAISNYKQFYEDKIMNNPNIQIDFQKIYQKEPDLTIAGIEVNGTDKLTVDHEDQILKCYHWLSSKHIYKSMNNLSSSYFLKHMIEAEMGGYVSNGSFIAAVILLDIPYRKYSGSLNINVPVKNKGWY